jgi:hypothetical protein
MREDAELVYIKYEKKFNELESVEKQVNDKLNARVAELDAEAKSIKAVLFDAKLQFRSNEMKEDTYQQIKIQTDELLEHITNEKAEISNVKSKLTAQTIENINAQTSTAAAATVSPSTSSVVVPSTNEEGGESRHSSVSNSEPTAESAPIPVSATATEEERPLEVSANVEDKAPAETSWLNQVIPK